MGAIANLARDQLASGIDSVVTTITLVDASEFPDPATEGGPYEIMIWPVSVNPNPADSPTDVEFALVLSKSVDDLDLDRPNPIPHNAGGVTYAVGLPASAWNVRNHLHKDVALAGADTSGAADVSAEVDATKESDRELYFPPGTYFFSADYTFERDVTVRMANGAQLKPSGTATLHFRGQLIAPRVKIFDLSNSGAAVNFADYGANEEVYPEWFGAVADADDAKATANTKAFVDCMDAVADLASAGRARVSLADGVYKTDDIVGVLPGVTLEGVSPETSVISQLSSAPAATQALSLSAGAAARRLKVIKEGGTGHGVTAAAKSVVDDIAIDNRSIDAADAALQVEAGNFRNLVLDGDCGVGLDVWGDQGAFVDNIELAAASGFHASLVNLSGSEKVFIDGLLADGIAVDRDHDFELDHAVSATRDITVRNAFIGGTGSPGHAVESDDAHNVTFADVYFGAPPTSLSSVVILRAGSHIRFLRCAMESTSSEPIDIRSDGVVLEDCIAINDNLAFAWDTDARRAATRIGRFRNETNASWVGNSSLFGQFHFAKPALAASQTATQVEPLPGAPFTKLRVPYDAIIAGVTCEMTSGLTAGALDVELHVNGVLHSTYSFDTGTNDFRLRSWSNDPAADYMGAGEHFEVLYSSDASADTNAGIASTGLLVTVYLEKVGEPQPNT